MKKPPAREVSFYPVMAEKARQGEAISEKGMGKPTPVHQIFIHPHFSRDRGRARIKERKLNLFR